jgi:5-methyltetrahydrofolate--homocysteine methyltransferase
MELAYKENWRETQERYRAWWANDALDRAAIGIRAPREKPIPGPPAPSEPPDLLTRWTDGEYIAARADHAFRHTFCGGEHLPKLFVNLGPGIAATYVGSAPTFDERTVWFGPTISDWRRAEVRFDPNGYWWETTKRLTATVAEAATRKFFVSITDLGGVTDIIASLRGTANLNLDLLDHPDEVKALRGELIGFWKDRYLELERLLAPTQEGTACWAGSWSPGRTYNIQCDFCCMISPAMFEEFVAPELEGLCRWLDHTTYHLDGPGAIKHLDRLLAIPELHGIQWSPGDGAPPNAYFLPMFRKIQAAGKILLLFGDAADAARVLPELSPRGVFYDAGGVASEREATDFLRQAKAWATDRH